MSYSHLKGRIFSRDGTNYLVIDANDWASETLNVRSINASKKIYQMPRDVILECIGVKQQASG